MCRKLSLAHPVSQRDSKGYKIWLKKMMKML